MEQIYAAHGAISTLVGDLSDLLDETGRAETRDNVEVALDLARRGLPVFPCRARGETLRNGETRPPKSPHIANFSQTASSDEEQIRLWWTKWPDALVGVPTGARTGICVLDVDIKSDGFNSLTALGYDAPASLTPVRTRTGSGGAHLFFSHEPRCRNSASELANGLDTRAEGGLVIAPGSLLPDGRRYVSEGLPLGTVTLPPYPEDLIVHRAAPVGDVPIQNASPEQMALVRDEIAALVETDLVPLERGAGRQNALRTHVAFRAGQYGAHGAIDEGTARALLYGGWRRMSGVDASYDREFDRNFRAGWEDGLAKPRHLPIIVDPEDFDDTDLHDLSDLLNSDVPAPKPKHDLLASSSYSPMRNDDGGLKMSLYNVCGELLRLTEKHSLDIRFNEMTREPVWRDGRIDDRAVSSVRMLLERHAFHAPVGKDLAHDAVLHVAMRSRFHPIRDHLRSLQWDGVERVSGMLRTYFGSADNPYTRGVSRAFLIAMVARVMQPGCKHDCALLLTGGQGAFKSTAAKVLAGGDRWFTDSLPSVKGDAIEAARHLPGKWIVELGEMSSLSKGESDDVKRFLSGAVDRVRLPYGRRDEELPRQCVFIGSSNNPECLRDETGNRRFWPVAVGARVHIKALERDRDQLLAEAVVAFDAGEQWWLTPELEALARVEQESAREADVWEDRIREWLDDEGDGFDGERVPRARVKLHEVLSEALGIATERQGMTEQRRVGRCLRALGWNRSGEKSGKFWVRRDG